MSYWAIAFENVGIIACFTAVAIYFGHWWIILFGGLILTTVKLKD